MTRFSNWKKTDDIRRGQTSPLTGVLRLFNCGSTLLAGVLLFFLSWTAQIDVAFGQHHTPLNTWKVILGNHVAFPPRLVAVDKDKQQLFVYSKKRRFDLDQQFICTTGKRLGDKQTQGDLKTPEGVYFVVKQMNSGLDYTQYGYAAYTLNYPNPVDRLRGKTGYGIWIHGRGERISPLVTQGCVALNNDDLEELGGLLIPGTPVTLAGSLAQTPKILKEDELAAQRLTKSVREWARSWANRSTALFDFYDQEAYSLAQDEPFNRFKAQKERLFKLLPWIKTTVADIQILKGPGYWVTWFHQDYQAPNLTTQGVRRLYWAQDQKGAFRIVGMEWLPGMTAGANLAAAEAATPPSQRTDTSEEQAVPVDEAILQAREEGTRHPLLAAIFGSEGKSVSVQNNAEELPKPLLALNLVEQGLLKVSDGRIELNHSAQPMDQMASTLETTGQDGTMLAGLPEPLPSQRLSGLEQNNQTSMLPATPLESLAANRTDGSILLASLTQQQSGGAEPGGPLFAAQLSDQDRLLVSVNETLEEWRQAWQAADIDWYMEFYLDGAVQGSRKNSKTIKDHKIRLWGKKAPRKIAFDDIAVQLDGNKAFIEMIQSYEDASGQGDRGIKTMMVELHGDMWFIVSEEWRPMP